MLNHKPDGEDFQRSKFNPRPCFSTGERRGVGAGLVQLQAGRFPVTLDSIPLITSREPLWLSG
ncbi:MAG: hypothetical protein ABW185_14165 [Sedimenticola sp.]